MNYSDAGVSIKEGDAFVKSISSLTKKTFDKHVISGIGGFCSCYENPHHPDQIVAACTDGVGTKVLFATEAMHLIPPEGLFRTLGVDLVAMNVNDIITSGALPAFFLDYYATGKLNVVTGEHLISGITLGCRLSGCSLVGGETSEMPGMYEEGHYDMAGFCVGFVRRDDWILKTRVQENDAIFGIHSSGPHSNGYSLIRKAYEGFDFSTNVSLLLALLRPTQIYVPAIKHLLSYRGKQIHGMANITGGGLEHNTNRSVPDNLKANIDWSSWEMPEVFSHIQSQGNIEEEEMRKVFNCGIGFVIIAPEEMETTIQVFCNIFGQDVSKIGRIIKREE